MRRLPLVLLLGLVLALVACGGDDKEEAAAPPEATSDATPAPAEAGGCEKVSEPAPRKAEKLAKPKLELDAAKTYVARVLTSCGEFEITLDAKRAPRTGGAFLTLVRKGFYDGLIFHRIVPGFVIQGGDPEGQGSGGPGFSVVESPPEDVTYTKGVVAMAKTQVEAAGTSGSQFFVVTGPKTDLPPDYAVLGKVVSGMDAVKAIESKSSAQDGPPSEPVVMERVTVTAGGSGSGSAQ